VDLVSVRTFLNHIDADLARTALEAAGIESVISADDAGGMETGLWVGPGVRLLVNRNDLQEADAVLSESIDPPEE